MLETRPQLVESPWPARISLAAVGLAFLGTVLLVVGPSLLESGGREASRRSRCVNSLKMIGLALQTYHDQHKVFPPAIVTNDEGQPMHSWRVLILPHFEDAELVTLYERYRFDEPWNGPHNSKLHAEIPEYLRCPTDEAHPDETSYLAVVDEQTLWPGTATLMMREVTDGTSRTIAVVETTDSGIHWLEPRDLSLEQAMRGINPKGPGPAIRSRHASGAHALTSDGAAHWFSDEIPPDTLRALLTARGGEDVEIPEY